MDDMNDGWIGVEKLMVMQWRIEKNEWHSLICFDLNLCIFIGVKHKNNILIKLYEMKCNVILSSSNSKLRGAC